MPRVQTVRLAALAVGAALLTSAYVRIHSASVMTDAARALLNALTPEQRSRIQFAIDDSERMNWFYTPVKRQGLPVRDMQPYQRKLAFGLLAAGLSQQGYIKATTIMSLEEVLRVIEQGKGPVRDPDLYFFSIFGEPSETGVWGYRVEGHHVSQNFTVVNGKVAGAPSFFGANPEEVKDGPRKGLRTLPREEDFGRDLIKSLTAAQRDTAIVDKQAYRDILTTNSRQAALEGRPTGLQATRMTAQQRRMLNEIIGEYAYNMPDPIAQARLEEAKAAGGNLWFAWAGGIERGQPHYYRVQSPSFLIEFDDTQDHANHIHSVWRDFNGDFGRDLLKEHYQTSHNAGK